VCDELGGGTSRSIVNRDIERVRKVDKGEHQECMISIEEVDRLRASGVCSWVENSCACIEILEV
jgi:hypothetical protein